MFMTGLDIGNFIKMARLKKNIAQYIKQENGQ